MTPPPPSHLPAENLLGGEASPYLRQHAENPVHWRPWSAAALAEAAAQDRPILLSIGYAACHWCHVMAHESFESPEIAALMNRLFVNIKVDREERPDIDQIYMAALAAMGEQGGWPLTMFLTPQGKPFWGGTYFAPQPRFGRPGFVQVLEAVDKAWREKRESLARSADSLSGHVDAHLAGSRPKAPLEAGTLTALAEGIHGMVDMQAGGLRGAPKFPNAPFLHTLWLSWLTTADIQHRDAVLLSLQKMLAGGIYDHVGGGLCRYSTDAEWTVPHFEKMLYDNAQLLRLCNWALAETGNDLFRLRIEETVAWMRREMHTPEGGFAASLDADSESEEGLFYTWTDEEIATALGDDTDTFNRFFALDRPAAWEGKPILRQSDAQQAAEIADPAATAPIKARLLAARAARVRPSRDGKVLSDWNGLAIAALAECGRALSRPEWIEAAATAFRTVDAAARDGRLAHSMLGGQKLFPALSGDYAAFANAAISLHEATGAAAYAVKARHYLDQLDRWHADESGESHFLTASDAADVPIRIRGDVDDAIPSATAQIVEAFVRLAALTGDAALQQKAWAVAEHAAGRARVQPYGQAGIVNACALALQAMKLVVIDDPAAPTLVAVANRNPDPRRVDLFVPLGTPSATVTLPGDALPATDRPGAYLCTGQICLAPIADPNELERTLRRR